MMKATNLIDETNVSRQTGFCTGPCPVFNTADLDTLRPDEKGHFRSLEYIALPGTKFSVLSEVGDALEVSTPEYPKSPLYIEKKCLSSSQGYKREMPTREQILSRLEKALGLPYFWGGNCFEEITFREHTWKGVDCSGLLYAATDGYTPRNTHELLKFGEPLASPSELKPLDIVVWPGHVVIVFSDREIIESAEGKGVILTPKKERLSQIERPIYRNIFSI